LFAARFCWWWLLCPVWLWGSQGLPSPSSGSATKCHKPGTVHTYLTATKAQMPPSHLLEEFGDLHPPAELRGESLTSLQGSHSCLSILPLAFSKGLLILVLHGDLSPEGLRQAGGGRLPERGESLPEVAPGEEVEEGVKAAVGSGQGQGDDDGFLQEHGVPAAGALQAQRVQVDRAQDVVRQNSEPLWDAQGFQVSVKFQLF
uniref:Uncharacterized protein n=1 Tax=Cyanistes caeruleus TaxID=156563 RepID=A0A8C0UKL3_CYACU